MYRKQEPRDMTVLDACDVIAAAEEAKRGLRFVYRNLCVVQQRARAINVRTDIGLVESPQTTRSA